MRTFFLDEAVSQNLNLDKLAEIEKNLPEKDNYIAGFIKMFSGESLRQMFNIKFLSSNLPLLGFIIKQKKFNEREQIFCEKILHFMVNEQVQQFVLAQNIEVSKVLLKSKLFFKIRSSSKDHQLFYFFIEANNDFGKTLGLHDIGIEPKGFAIALMQSYAEEITPLEGMGKKRIFL